MGASGPWMALACPGVAPAQGEWNQLDRSLVEVANTRTGEVRELMTVDGIVIDSDRLLWVQY